MTELTATTRLILNEELLELEQFIELSMARRDKIHQLLGHTATEGEL